jgi:demethylmenaquinone methyltransferase / 2-methoxy-6-polyprenyl-1,4-benzoquinol methylase
MPPDLPPLQDTRLELVDRLFTGTGQTYDSMVHWATFGIDRLWKRRMLELIPHGDGPVLDLACGTGISTLSIARRFPHRQVIGVELRDEYLQFAREKVRRESLDNVELVLCRAEDFHSTTVFDCITSSYLAKYADLPLLTRNCREMLGDGGVLMMHDFTYPPKPALVALFRLYFMVMKQTVARAFPAWQEIYDGLPRLIEQTRWLEELEASLARERFVDVRREYLTVYGSAIVRAVKAPDQGRH